MPEITVNLSEKQHALLQKVAAKKSLTEEEAIMRVLKKGMSQVKLKKTKTKTA